MIELWGGLECTVNRVGSRYFDQIARTGHGERVDDIDRIAALGIRQVRYPVLWERIAPDGVQHARWERVDAHLRRLQLLGLRPIAGLLHHGSGPRGTSLIDPRFPEALAEYAGAVAQRYPWINAWTPINEPMVTARFSGLYGHWYPHLRDDASFCRMVVNQCRAIVLAMIAVRRVNAHAEYIHTDDGGTTFSTAPLEYQATFENQRRDLALDLLYGRVDAQHALWPFLRRNRIAASELEWFMEQRVTPDVIGIDYYATSDRYLDHRLAPHPAGALGGNGTHSYADVAAAGNMPEWRVGFADALMRVHAAYDAPVALTEVHMGCTREEQLRWLQAALHGAHAAQRSGANVRAVTSWAMFGTLDWDQLVTVESGHYESGAFDVRAPVPRPTAIAGALASIAATGAFTHPVLAQPGWWSGVQSRTASNSRPFTHKRILILGSKGTLGAAFVRKCEQRGLAHLPLSRAEVDIREAMEVKRAVAACRPWAVINATGFVNVDAAEGDRDSCERTNALGAMHVAEACARVGAQLLSFSSDLVFNGAQSTPYLESHVPDPLSVYGESKHSAEDGMRERLDSALIVRTSAFFGPWDEHNFVARVLRLLGAGLPVLAPGNVVSPTYVPALVDATLDLLIDREQGLWHVSNSGAISWVNLARMVASQAGFDAGAVRECEPGDIGWVAPRPAYSALASMRGTLLPSIETSLEQYLSARPPLAARLGPT